MPRKKRIVWLLNAFPPTSKKKTIQQPPRSFSIFCFSLGGGPIKERHWVVAQ